MIRCDYFYAIGEAPTSS